HIVRCMIALMLTFNHWPHKVWPGHEIIIPFPSSDEESSIRQLLRSVFIPPGGLSLTILSRKKRLSLFKADPLPFSKYTRSTLQ
ncbi:hypothetical protein KIL84_003240, partial [Mauremys mutica]